MSNAPDARPTRLAVPEVDSSRRRRNNGCGVAEPSMRRSFSADEGTHMGQYDTSREQVVSVCRALLERGYLKATEGNVSARVPGQGAFAITPSNYDYAKMKSLGVVVVAGCDREGALPR